MGVRSTNLLGRKPHRLCSQLHGHFFYKYWFPGFPWDHAEHYMALATSPCSQTSLQKKTASLRWASTGLFLFPIQQLEKATMEPCF